MVRVSAMKSSLPAILLLLLAGALLSGAASSAPATLPPEAAKLAKEFLFAFSRNDRDKITEMLPRRLADRYGPCPFAGVPAVTKILVDGSSATVRFEGPAEGGMPGKGVLVLRR